MKLVLKWTDIEKHLMMKEICSDAQEHVPVNESRQLGKSTQVNVYCDVNHAGNQITRRSHIQASSFILIQPSFHSIDIQKYSPL